MGLRRRHTASSAVAGLLALSGLAEAFWRMPCRSRTGLMRVDPIMDFGEISDHVHALHGGGNLNPSSKPEDLQASSCTSCEVTQDKSAYWTPSLHFLFENGTSVVVPQVGGMLAYYLLYTDPAQPNSKITAFPQGFQMVSGNKNYRNFTWPVPDPPKSDWSGDQVSQFALSQKALGFNCLNYDAAPEGSLYRHFMPEKDYLDANCKDGLRLELMFPSCWNGHDVDSPDHQSHVAFPNQVMTGTCPDGFETKLPSLFFETIWNTYAFAGIPGQFVLSNGDPTGYGYHGDFMMGWDEAFLQQAVNTCTNLSGQIEDCPLFNIQSDDDAAQCLMETPNDLKNDNAAGPRNGLAINVPIQAGPEPATSYPIRLANDATYMPPLTQSSIKSTGLVPTLTYSPAKQTTIGVTSGMTDSTAPAAYDASLTRSGVASTLTSVTTVPQGNQAQVLSTSTVTQSDGGILEIVIEQVVVTVTGTGTPPASVLASVAAQTSAASPIDTEQATESPWYGNIHVNPDGSVYTDKLRKKRHAGHGRVHRHVQKMIQL